ncbi:hypothetical protein [Bosea sp. BK604]|uniref:hypothetical protein n=1 Tax=Bosea sp. BK604 TaxID=2512180 RepID=UPI00104EF551|nr:hypothetical protein [Bosea sp. BK604]TCR64675.1 hypothetical protein EV560_106140 [Bosea sp. BK604]
MAVALERISGRQPVIRRRNLFPDDGPSYSVPESCSWVCPDDKRLEALTIVDGSLRSAPEGEIVKALYELRTLTRGRVNRDQSEDEAEAIIWTEKLRAYPADIVLETLRNWPNRSDGQWWPTWHDVQKIVEAETSARRMLAEHIRSGACLPKPKVDEEVERDDSPEGIARREAFVAKVRERFGIKSHKGESVVDREALTDTKRAELDAVVTRQAERIAAEGLPQLSAEALGALTPMMSRAEYEDYMSERRAKPDMDRPRNDMDERFDAPADERVEER